jgi:hypothetical protein
MKLGIVKVIGRTCPCRELQWREEDERERQVSNSVNCSHVFLVFGMNKPPFTLDPAERESGVPLDGDARQT